MSFFFVSLNTDMVCDELIKKINQELPKGLVINGCETQSTGRATQAAHVDHYTVTLKDGEFDRHQLAWFAESSRIDYKYKNKKGIPGSINLKDSIVPPLLVNL